MDSTEWAIAIVFAPKKNRWLRTSAGYRKVYVVTVRDLHTLQRIDKCVKSLTRTPFFSRFDAEWDWWAQHIRNGVHDSAENLPIGVNAFWLEEPTVDDLTTDGYHLILSELVVSLGIPFLHLDLLGERQQSHGALGASTSTASRGKSRTSVEVLLVLYWEKLRSQSRYRIRMTGSFQNDTRSHLGTKGLYDSM